jgi:hypothetical protein
MISKEEFIKLYCDELVYKLTGVMGVDRDKAGYQLRHNEKKAKQDLEDYGYPPVDVKRVGNNTIMTWDVNDQGGRNFNSDVDPFKDDFDSVKKSLDKLNDFIETMAVEDFDWGSEDSIQ